MELKKKDITITIDIDADEAIAKLNDIEQQLDRIINKSNSIEANISKHFSEGYSM